LRLPFTVIKVIFNALTGIENESFGADMAKIQVILFKFAETVVKTDRSNDDEDHNDGTYSGIGRLDHRGR